MEQSSTETKTSHCSLEAALSDLFIASVLKPISGPLRPSVVISHSQIDSMLRISHKALLNNKYVNFDYAIKYSNSSTCITVPDIVDLSTTNVIQVPLCHWDAVTLEKLRCAWRRVVIADPILNPRLSGRIALDGYQQNAIEAALRRYQAASNGLIVMATATGKTIVGLEIVDRLLENCRLSHAHETKRSGLLYLVNNTIILEDAIRTAKRMFANKYEIGKVFSGYYTPSVDLNFASTSSLFSEKRFECFFSNYAPRIVIFDETHHLPATGHSRIYQKILEHSKSRGLDIKILGLTATEFRTDQKSVINPLGGIVYAYPIINGWQEGYLTPVKFYANETKTNSQLHVHDLKNVYWQHIQDLLDRRALILTNTITRAEQIAEDFNANGIPSIALHSGFKQRQPRSFRDHYLAWKTGAWPKDSDHKSAALPEVVVGVDMFREGIDVPAINLMMLDSDTNSPQKFVQWIGRGLRQSPFKTHLRVVDTVGLYQKGHLIKALSRFIESERIISNSLDSSFESHATNKQRLLQNDDLVPTGMQFSNEVSATIRAAISDIPALLYFRNKLGVVTEVDQYRLTNFFLDRLGLRAFDHIPEFIRNLAEDISKATDGDQLVALRAKINPIFLTSGRVDLDRLEPQGPVLIVFNHLCQLWSKFANEHPTEMLYKILPEFNPQRRDLLGRIAINLRQFRFLHLGLAAEDLQVILSNTTNVQMAYKLTQLEQALLSLPTNTFAQIVTLAEHPVIRTNTSIPVLSLPIPLKPRAEDCQLFLAKSYSAMPSIAGLLTVASFQDNPKQFRNLLFQKGLVLPSLKAKHETFAILERSAKKELLHLSNSASHTSDSFLESTTMILQNLLKEEFKPTIRDVAQTRPAINALRQLTRQLEDNKLKAGKLLKFNNILGQVEEKYVQRIISSVNSDITIELESSHFSGHYEFQIFLKVNANISIVLGHLKWARHASGIDLLMLESTKQNFSNLKKTFKDEQLRLACLQTMSLVIEKLSKVSDSQVLLIVPSDSRNQEFYNCISPILLEVTDLNLLTKYKRRCLSGNLRNTENLNETLSTMRLNPLLQELVISYKSPMQITYASSEIIELCRLHIAQCNKNAVVTKPSLAPPFFTDKGLLRLWLQSLPSKFSVLHWNPDCIKLKSSHSMKNLQAIDVTEYDSNTMPLYANYHNCQSCKPPSKRAWQHIEREARSKNMN